MATLQTQKKRRPADGLLTRSRGKVLVIFAATIAFLYLSFLLARPFLPAIVWAVTGAVVTQPLVRWLDARSNLTTLNASVAVGVVAVLLFAPVVSLLYFVAIEIRAVVASGQLREMLDGVAEALADYPSLAEVWQRISANLDLSRAAEQIGEQIGGGTMAVVSGSLYTLLQVFVALFILFFLYRDRERVLAAVYRLSPLTKRETDALLERVEDTIHATIFGTVVVALVQGILGGAVFWMLGLPAVVLWATVMTVASLIPYVGSSIVWAPAAVILAATGAWGKALLLVAWGTVVIGLIDNLLYPVLLGNRLRQHVVIMFLAIVGGITVFGTTGIVLGPVVVTVTFFLLEIWRRRTQGGRRADQAAG